MNNVGQEEGIVQHELTLAGCDILTEPSVFIKDSGQFQYTPRTHIIRGDIRPHFKYIQEMYMQRGRLYSEMCEEEGAKEEWGVASSPSS